jgi:CDP-glucose 4,6-dehydratase
MNPAFWDGKRVFMTGHTGFKGGWLSLWLQQLGADLTGYSLPAPTSPSLFDLASVADGMHSLIGDIRDSEKLISAMKNAKPEIVIHMAAQPLVRRSYIDPVETYSTNVMGTVYLFEAIRKTPSVRSVVNVTTDKCYENNEWIWPYRENEPMGGYDPYSNSKGCSELVTSSYRNSYFNAANYQEHGVALATARSGNVIGGGDWAVDRLVPDILSAFAQKNLAIIRNPNAIRPWQHVLDPLRGYLTLAEKLHAADGINFAQAFNFGSSSDDAKSVEWAVKKLASLWGQNTSWQIDGANHPHEANYLKLDISKAAHLLNWRPLLSIEKALELTVDWARAWQDDENLKEKTISQINEYLALIN